MTTKVTGAIQPWQGGPQGVEPPKKAVVAFEEKAGGHAAVEVEEEDDWETQRAECRRENLKECGSICCFSLFITVFSFTIAMEQSYAASRLASHIRGKVEGTRDVPLDSVVTTDTWYTFMEQALIPSIYDDSLDTRLALEESARLPPIDSVNRLLGAVRIRQKRVSTTKDCQVTPMFSEYSVTCYPPYRDNMASTAAFGPGNKYVHSGDDEGITYGGQLSSYSKGGFIEFLATNRTDALAKLQELAGENFLGAPTRAIFVDFTVWSSNWATYAVVTLVFEFGPSGRVTQTAEVLILSPSSLRFAGQRTFIDVLVVIGIVVTLGFVVWYVYEEGQEFWDNKLDYFNDVWNILDWTNLVILVIAFILRVMLWTGASSLNIGELQMENKDSFQNLRGIARLSEYVKISNSFNCLLFWIKVAKFLKHLPVVRGLIATIMTAAEFLGPFLLMFFITFLGFALAFNIGFGDKFFELSTVDRAFIYLFKAFVKDVTLIRAYDLAPFFGAMLILVFYVTMLLVVTNMIFAICADAIMENHYKKKVDDNGLRQDMPVEEFVDLIKGLFWRCVKMGKGKPKDRARFRDDSDEATTGRSRKGKDGGGGGGALALQDRRSASKGSARSVGSRKKTTPAPERGMLEDGRSSSRSSSSRDSGADKRPSKKMLMHSIEHMAGRVISEVSIIGIEIRAELHEICERVAEMQMAVRELTERLEIVKDEQHECIAAGEQMMDRLALTNG